MGEEEGDAYAEYIDGSEPEDGMACISSIFRNDDFIKMIAAYIPGIKELDEEQVRSFMTGMAPIVNTYGADMLSGGNPDRKAKVQNAMDSVGGYAELIKLFMPILRSIIDGLKSRSQATDSILTDEDWPDDFNPDVEQSQQPQHQSEGDVNPDFLLENDDSRDFGASGNLGGLTFRGQRMDMESIIKRHMSKFASNDGLDNLVKDAREQGFVVNVDVPKNNNNSRTSVPEVGVRGSDVIDISSTDFGDDRPGADDAFKPNPRWKKGMNDMLNDYKSRYEQNIADAQDEYESALAELDQRYASGELSTAEYNEQKQLLQDQSGEIKKSSSIDMLEVRGSSDGEQHDEPIEDDYLLDLEDDNEEKEEEDSEDDYIIEV